ncbi:MAG: RsiV family protein [Ignavibacteria bacterium]|nr:RsiV family protein [Ignavibacteria bacterium]
MKKLPFLLIIVTIFNVSFSGDKYWFKSLSGTIDSYPVILNVVKAGDDLRGYYYYEKNKKPMVVYGTFKGDSLVLSAYFTYEDSEIFSGIFSGGSYTGTWRGKDGSKNSEFRLKEQKISSDFEYVYVEGSERLFKDIESPNAHYSDGIVWPTDKYSNSLFLRNAILKQKNLKSGLTAIGDIMLAEKKKYMKDFFEYNKDVKRDDVSGDGGWSYSLDQVDIIMPVYFDGDLFVISSYDYSYTGGAHGNYGTFYTNLDLKRKKILSLDDVLTKKGIDKMPELLEKYYKLERNIPSGTSLMESGLFVDTIRTNDNFLISPGNIMFNYIPYEIASYADGEVTIFVPYEEFSGYVKPEVKELFR